MASANGQETTLPTKQVVKLLLLTSDLQEKHGLRHQDYHRYRTYCSSRIARLRKRTNLAQVEKKRYAKKDVTAESLAKTAEAIEIPIMQVERAWAHAMQLKFEMNTEPRKRYHMIQRLRVAIKNASTLKRLVSSATTGGAINVDCDESQPSQPLYDGRTMLEVEAYLRWLTGLLYFERRKWANAYKAFATARKCYSQLASVHEATGDDDCGDSVPTDNVYRRRETEIGPSLRFCLYNLEQDTSVDAAKKVAKLKDLFAADASHGDSVINDLLADNRAANVSHSDGVVWRSRKLVVKSVKVRAFLDRFDDTQTKLANLDGTDSDVIALYESLLVDCKDAIQVVRDEGQQAKTSQPSKNQVNLLTMLTFMKLSLTVVRNWAMADQLAVKWANASQLSSTDASDSKTRAMGSTKPHEVVRLYELIISCLRELRQLPGLDECDDVTSAVDIHTNLANGCRLRLIAESFMSLGRFAEAHKVCELASRIILTIDGQLSRCSPETAATVASIFCREHSSEAVLALVRRRAAELRKELGDLNFAIHPRSFVPLSALSNADDLAMDEDEADHLRSVPLAKRTELFFEDTKLGSKHYRPKLVDFPPPFQPVPCKPLFFDVAGELNKYPLADIERRLEKLTAGSASIAQSIKSPAKDAASSSSSVSSSWFGSWFGQKKK